MRTRENEGEKVRARARRQEVLLRFAKNADRGVIICICEAADLGLHVDTSTRAAALPDDGMNLIYKL